MTAVTASRPRPAGRDQLRGRFRRELRASGLPVGPGDRSPVTATDLEGLPDAVRRYLGFMEVVGRPRVWSFRLRFSGRFRLRADGGWMPAEAWQYNCAAPVGRVFVMRLRFAGVVPLVGADTYLGGRGRMLGRLLDRFPVVDAAGTELDVGELTTWLNDAVLFAPSMLLGPATTWDAVDHDSFDVTVVDGPNRVTGRVFVDEHGAPHDFSSTDRFVELPAGLVRAEWRTPVPRWVRAPGGWPFPGPAGAEWHLPDGVLPYVEGTFDPASFVVDVPPVAP